MSELKFTLDIWSILLIGVAFQGYFLASLLFWQKEGNRSARHTLGGLLLVVSLILTEYLFLRSGLFLVDFQNYIIFVTTPLLFLEGPLYYFYARVLLDRKPESKSRWLWHLLPFAVCLINFIPIYTGAFADLVSPDSAAAKTYSPLVWVNGYIYMGVYIVQMGIYVSIAYRKMHERGESLKNIFSRSSLPNAMWLEKLGLVFVAVMVVHLVSLGYLILKRHIVEVEYAMALSVASLILLVGYLSIRNPEILAGRNSGQGIEKYQKARLPEEQTKSYLNRLLQLMETDKPYLDCDLTMADLAAMLSVSANHLSQTLNRERGQNFFDFINQYRVREAKNRLVDPRFNHLTILAIALDVGFSNKTSFNRIFKKFTEMTPSSFVKKHRAA